MMNHVTCSYPGDREGAIIDYLYGEADADARLPFDRHLVECAVCRAEVDDHRGARRALAAWTPPPPLHTSEGSPALTGPRLATPSDVAAPPVPRLSISTVLPVWARVAAAVLCVGVGVGAANLRVTYSSDGLTVRTGWLSEAPRATPAAAEAEPEPWRAQLAAVAEQLRREMAERKASQSAASTLDDPGRPGGGSAGSERVEEEALLRQVRALIARSEQRQQRELALRVGNALNDVQVQRRADLARIDRAIGVMQSSTGMDLLRQREAINTLAVRVSGQR